jgi:orotidine-5'-phosphate decarboxylase
MASEPASADAACPHFTKELSARILAGRPAAVVGLDPRPEALPRTLAPTAPPARRIAAFHEAILPAITRHVPAIKPNIAFFERFGADGYRAYEETCATARQLGCLVIGDVTRGDIGSTAEAYAEQHFTHADAVTLHPYLGSDSLAPFLRRGAALGKGSFVLVRTSNPSAREFQDLPTPQGRLCDAVADAVAAWGRDTVDEHGYSLVGAVVGATYAEELAGFRRRMPHAWLLLPGVGAQGASVDQLGAAFDARGLGALITQSRGITQCFAPGDADWRARIEDAAAAFAAEVLALQSR